MQGGRNASRYIILSGLVSLYFLLLTRVRSVVGLNPTRGSSFFFRNMTALGVLCCFALLFVWPCLLLPSFLPSFCIPLTHKCIYRIQPSQLSCLSSSGARAHAWWSQIRVPSKPAFKRNLLWLFTAIYYTYLLIDSCNDGAPDPQAEREAAMEVLMQEEGLYDGCEEQQRSIQVALPIRLTLIFCERYHQPTRTCIDRGRENSIKVHDQ